MLNSSLPASFAPIPHFPSFSLPTLPSQVKEVPGHEHSSLTHLPSFQYKHSQPSPIFLNFPLNSSYKTFSKFILFKLFPFLHFPLNKSLFFILFTLSFRFNFIFPPLFSFQYTPIMFFFRFSPLLLF